MSRKDVGCGLSDDAVGEGNHVRLLFNHRATRAGRRSERTDLDLGVGVQQAK